MRLLVTRPEPDAERTAQALRAARARGAGRAAAAHRNDRGGIRRALRCRADDQRERGARCRQACAVRCAARSAGVCGWRPNRRSSACGGLHDRRSADGALADLVRLVAERVSAAALSRCSISRARTARAISLAMLSGLGIAVETVVIYRAVAASRLPDDVTQALRRRTSTACCITRGAAPRRCSRLPNRRACSARCSISRIFACPRRSRRRCAVRARSGSRSRRARTGRR